MDSPARGAPPAAPAPSPGPASAPSTPQRTPRGGGRTPNRRHEPSARGGAGASRGTPSPRRGAPSTPKSASAKGAPLARSDASPGAADAPKRGQRDRRERPAKAALSKEELDEGLRTGRFYSGLLRVNPSTRKTEAYVVVPGFARDVLITGTAARGRAFDGDTVAVELFEYSRWQVVTAAAGAPAAAALAASDSDDEPADDADVPVPASPLAPAEPASLTSAVSERLAAASAPLAVPRGAEPDALAASPFIAAPASSPVAATPPHLAASSHDADADADDDDDDEPDVPSHFAPAVAPPSPLPGAGHALPAPSTPVEGEVRRPTGRIVAVLEAGHQELFAGTVRPCGRRDKQSARTARTANGGKVEEASGVAYTDRMAFFVPLERRCPKLLVRLPTMTPHSKLLAEFNDANNLFVAKLTGWTAASSLPHAQLLSLLGNASAPHVQHDALTVTHDLPRDDFPADALAAVPPEASRDVQPADLAGRRDLRGECVFTIDPVTARDLDDALHVKELGGGRCEVGIHIADVAHFLRPGTPLDREARRRATSVYLVHKVIPMLPRLLCEHACSLNPGADRLAFSVVVTLDEEGRVQGEPWFGRTVIHSVAKLSYDSAQALLDGAPAPAAPPLTAPTSRYTAEHIRAAVRRLHALSLPMRRRRFESGALQLGSSKLVFTLNAEGAPIAVGTYALKETNRLIEEFMLLANVAVARRIAQAFPDGALLRRHAGPAENKLAELAVACAKLGAPLAVATAGTLNASLEALRARDPALHMVVQHMCTKPMQTAKYVATDTSLPPGSYAHYALSFAQYTHFTSPIRRYADVAVHRLLAAALEGGAAPFRKEELEAVVANCNRRKMNADKASDDCDYLYLCRYLQALPAPPVEEALVLELSPAKGWVVLLLPRYDIEEMLFLRDVQAQETWSAAQDQLTLEWADAPPVVLRVLTRVHVRLAVNTEIKPLCIRLQLVRQPLAP